MANLFNRRGKLMAQARLSGKSASCCQYRAPVMAPSVKPLYLKNTILAFIALATPTTSDVSKCNKMRRKCRLNGNR